MRKETARILMWACVFAGIGTRQETSDPVLYLIHQLIAIALGFFSGVLFCEADPK